MCLQQLAGSLEVIATILNCLCFRHQTKILTGIQMFYDNPLFSKILSWHNIHLQGDQGQTSKSFEWATRGLTIWQYIFSRVQRINISACQRSPLNHLSHFVAVWVAHHSLLLWTRHCFHSLDEAYDCFNTPDPRVHPVLLSDAFTRDVTTKNIRHAQKAWWLSVSLATLNNALVFLFLITCFKCGGFLQHFSLTESS